MWNLLRDLGNGEKLVSCSECGFQLVEKNLPDECPNCGEIMERLGQKAIDLKKSSLDVKEVEPEVYEYERDTPFYKLWYFWVGIIVVSLVVSVGGRVISQRLTAEPEPQGGEAVEQITFDAPTGWTKVNEQTYTGPGEGSDITVITCNVSRLDKIEDLGKLVADLSQIEEVESKEVNGIDGRYFTWTTRKIVDGQEYFTDYARYTFIHKSILYILTFKTTEGNLEVFDLFLLSIKI